MWLVGRGDPAEPRTHTPRQRCFDRGDGDAFGKALGKRPIVRGQQGAQQFLVLGYARESSSVTKSRHWGYMSLWPSLLGCTPLFSVLPFSV